MGATGKACLAPLSRPSPHQPKAGLSCRDNFRLLDETGPQGLLAGEIGAALALPPTSLSFHLKALNQAQLLSVVQEGRFLRYRADLTLMEGPVAFQTAECRGGQPQQYADLQMNPGPLAMQPTPLTVLFLRTHNSARST